MTIKDSYMLPRMDEFIDSVRASKVFTTLDYYNGYWQVLFAPQDRNKNSFVCHAGTYQYIQMAFGLAHAHATYKRALNMVLTKFKWKTCLVCIYDVIIY